MTINIPHRPLVLPPSPDDDAMAEWRAQLARLPDADEIDAAQEFIFRARDGYEFAVRFRNITRQWILRGVPEEEIGALRARWKSVAGRGDAAHR